MALVESRLSQRDLRRFDKVVPRPFLRGVVRGILINQDGAPSRCRREIPEDLNDPAQRHKNEQYYKARSEDHSADGVVRRCLTCSDREARKEMDDNNSCWLPRTCNPCTIVVPSYSVHMSQPYPFCFFRRSNWLFASKYLSTTPYIIVGQKYFNF